jgi:hypothetical protein
LAQRGGGLEFGLDLADEPAVAGQAEQVIDPVVLAPLHQAVAGKPRIVGLQPTGLTRGAQQNAHRGPAPADLGDDARHLFDRPVGLQPTGLTRGAAVDVGRAQLGRRQMPAAEDVERQTAAAIVITVEEAPLLPPVQRVVGRVEIEGDLRRWRCVRFEEEVDQEAFDRSPVIADLVAARGLRAAQLQPIERRFAGQRRTVRPPRRQLPRQHRHPHGSSPWAEDPRVVAQPVVIDQILIAEGDAIDALPDQGANLMLDQFSRPVIGKTAGKPLDQVDRSVGSAQQHRTGLRGHAAAVKPPPPPCAPRRVQNQTDPGYTLSASG